MADKEMIEDQMEKEVDSFFVQDLKFMSLATNYLEWQLKLVAPYLGGVQLEIGAGIGNFTSSLSKKSVMHFAIEPDSYCFEKLVHKTKNDDKVKVFNISSECLLGQDNLPKKFDTIISLNVLEHIECDVDAIKSWSTMLSENGKIVLIVPSGKYLYGTIDKKLLHYRRYSKDMIKNLATSSSLYIEKFLYMNSIGMLAWFLNNKIL